MDALNNSRVLLLVQVPVAEMYILLSVIADDVQSGILDGVHDGTNVIIQTVIMKVNQPPPSYGLPRRAPVVSRTQQIQDTKH